MEYAIVIFVAFGASMLTFFSGFGLGSMLTPAFILFFPPEIAVAATAIVHFLNNLFKLVLIGKHTVWRIALTFGMPAIIGAFIGAYLLGWIAGLEDDQTIHLFGDMSTSLINLIIGVLIIFFSLFELIPFLKRIQFKENKLLLGGLISGFFGGVSGHQGALRSAFLIKLPLTKEQFVATGIVIACVIDTIRIGTYAVSFDFTAIADSYMLVVSATLSAFIGAFIGKRLMKKVTIGFMQTLVGVLMIAIGVLLIFGFME
ncbi:MAG: sulfite exporter TauE/SafE family protein [Flavobacteriales bacterium]|nr:sulfite exporter TauE/SafE family protein [Flavobacteriales bacterium]